MDAVGAGVLPGRRPAPEPPAPAADPAAGRLAASATGALLREVAAAPKPGLVDRDGPGCHRDMDFMTFADSALALGPAFGACAAAGYRAAARGEAVDIPDAALWAELRTLGLEAERRMLDATGGVNTHRGALFSLGLLCAGAGAGLAEGFSGGALAARARRVVSGLCAGLPDRELPGRRSGTPGGGGASHGESAFLVYGARGIRGVAEDGFSVLDRGALDALRSRTPHGRMPDDGACVSALLSLMGEVEDTNVLHRAGPEGLALMRDGSRAVIAAGGMDTGPGRRALADLARVFAASRISPGGCADLLSAAIFLFDLERNYGS